MGSCFPPDIAKNITVLLICGIQEILEL